MSVIGCSFYARLLCHPPYDVVDHVLVLCYARRELREGARGRVRAAGGRCGGPLRVWVGGS